ncbi:unnamed protein product [Closterium sp. Yama58-4]|nr:unnamed protein product [Closterium sp. Yama58-4]
MTLVTVPSTSLITDATASGDATADGYLTTNHATAAGTTAVSGAVEPAPAFEEPPVSRQRRETEELLLAVNSSVLLRILSDVSLSAEDLARLELVCGFFRRPAHLTPHPRLSLVEVAAHDRCQQHSLRFRMLPPAQQRLLWARCGRSWKLLLRFLITSDSCIRHGQPQVAAGCAHSVAVGRGGEVWTFGHGSAGQLGRPLASASSTAGAGAGAGAAGAAAAAGGYAGFAAAAAAAVGGFAGLANDVTTTLATTATGAVTVTLRSGIETGAVGSGDASSAEPSWKPQIVRSLLGVRVVQAAAGRARTMLVSDTGSVYHFGRDCFGDQEYSLTSPEPVTEPRLVESLRHIQVVQVALGNFFTAVLSAEGRVFTLSWGGRGDGRRTPLAAAAAAAIAGGHCYLLGLTCAKEPHGRSVWSIGCGLGGKLGHGTKYDERRPKEIAHFKTLEFAPTAVAAGAWHAAAVAADGRVATWGWGRHGCLGHGKDQCETLPKLRPVVKACHVAAGDYTTFVVGEGGEVWSFGSAESACLGHGGGWEREDEEEGEEIDDADLHDIVVSGCCFRVVSCRVWLGAWGRSRALPSLPVALALPSPFPSLLLSPLPSRRSISRRSLPVPLGLSHPIPSLSLSPLPSRRSPSLPSLPVALSLSPLPSRRALSSRPSFPPGSSPISSPSLLLCNALSAPSFPPFTICLPSPHHSVLPLSPPITSFLLSSLPSRVLPLSPPITSFLLSSLPSRTLPLSLPIPSFPLSPLLSRRPPGHQSLLFAFAANQPSRRPSSFRTSFLSLF